MVEVVAPELSDKEKELAAYLAAEAELDKVADSVIKLKWGERFDENVMTLNTQKTQVLSNIRTNIKRHIQQVCPMAENPQPIAIVGGGWSTKKPEVFEELRECWYRGFPIVALNGAAKWLDSINIRPALHIILDARPENVVFLPDTKWDRCVTFLASQCDPIMFETALSRGLDPCIFHAVSQDDEQANDILNSYYGERRWMRIPPAGALGASTPILMRTQGFQFQDLFGLDSCYDPDTGEHHSFSQPLNDGEQTAEFQVGKEGRIFRCSAWQAAQARSFLKVILINGEHLRLHIHGDGLLAYLLQVAAEMPAPETKEKEKE